MSQNHLKIEHPEIGNRCHGYQNVPTRWDLQGETLSEVYFISIHHLLMNIPGWSEVRYRQFMATWTKLWTQNQSDQNGASVVNMYSYWRFCGISCAPQAQTTTFDYSWIECQKYAHKRLIPEKKRKGYNNFEATIGKLSVRRIKICLVYFCKIYFWSLFQDNVPNNAQTKIDHADLDSPRRILVCRGLRPFWGASVCTGIIF